MSGYIKLHRSIVENPMWGKEPFSAGQAWVDLLVSANFKDTSIYIRKTKINLTRGQIAWSTITMSKRWKWSRGKVLRFLSELKTEGMIVQEAGHLTTITTICNYSRFQDSNTADSTANDTTGGTADSTTGGTQYKNVKKDKNEKNTTGLDLSALPEGISEQTAKDFIEHRKLLKKPLTQRALNGCMATAAKAPSHGLTPDQVIDEAIIKGWMKPEPEWVAKSIAKDGGNVTPIRKTVDGKPCEYNLQPSGSVLDSQGIVKGWEFGGVFCDNPEYRRQA